MPEGRIHMELYIRIQIRTIQLLIFTAGIWTQDLTGTKPICYQLSYPGLDLIKKIIYLPSGLIFLLIRSILCIGDSPAETASRLERSSSSRFDFSSRWRRSFSFLSSKKFWNNSIKCGTATIWIPNTWIPDSSEYRTFLCSVFKW